MKNKKFIIGIAVILTLVIIGVVYAFCFTKTNKIVNLNEEFILKKGEIAKVVDKEIYLRLEDFINSPAPEGTQSIWSGLDVKYLLVVDGEKFDNSYSSKYNVNMIESDYETYAKFSISNKE